MRLILKKKAVKTVKRMTLFKREGLGGLEPGAVEKRRVAAQALVSDSESAMAWDMKGYCLRALGRKTEALAAFKCARLYLPVYAPIRYNLGTALREAGDLKGALAEFDEVLKLAPDDLPARLSRALVKLDLGDEPGARADFDECLCAELRGPALKKAGASRDVMEKTLISLSPVVVERKLTKKEVARINAALNEHKRVVVVQGPSKIKIFTLQGHKGAVRAAKKTKPWMSKKTKPWMSKKA